MPYCIFVLHNWEAYQNINYSLNLNYKVCSLLIFLSKSMQQKKVMCFAQGVPVSAPETLRSCFSEYEKDRGYEERWSVLSRISQSVHSLPSALSHPCSGIGVGLMACYKSCIFT